MKQKAALAVFLVAVLGLFLLAVTTPKPRPAAIPSMHYATLNMAVSSTNCGSYYKSCLSCPVVCVVSFQSHVSGGDPPYFYHWDFGNGYQSKAANPTETYLYVGFYNVNLTVRDSGNLDGDGLPAKKVTVPSYVNVR